MTIVANSANSGAEAKAIETAPVVEAPKAEKKAGEDIAKVEDVELKPIGRGKFGNIYNQFKGKAKEAIQFLLGKKEGEAIGALHHPDIGDIDLVWGKEGTGKSDGFGLAKLVKYHPEVLDNLQEILSDMHVTKRTENRVQLESDTHQAAVRLTWENEKKNWLLTAFEKRNSALDNTTDTVKISKRDMRNDTTTSQNTVSESKCSEKVEAKEENVIKSEGGRYPKELFEGVKDNVMAVRDAKTIFDKYSKVASIEEMIEYRDTLIAWDYLNGSISDAENGLTKNNR